MTKGRQLWLDAQQEGLNLITDPAYHTRIGNCKCVDTRPDLTFTHNARDADWLNLQENMGSDHFVVDTAIEAGPTKPKGN